MSGCLCIEAIGPGSTVQDTGRAGYLAQGLSRGGAADRLALLEGAALLAQDQTCAAIEITGAPARFVLDADARIALTGAPREARAGTRNLAWNASHHMAAGEALILGPATAGVYSYLHVGGGIAADRVLGSRSAHLGAGIGAPLAAGDRVALGADPGGPSGVTLAPEERLGGGRLRYLDGPHSALFSDAQRARFAATRFRRGPRGNRQGTELVQESGGAPFAARGQLSLLSETIVPGDIQMTGAGLPYILGPECQSIGGYPRIGTVLPVDMPRAMQAAPGETLHFERVEIGEALAVHLSDAAWMARCAARLRPLVRDPARMTDLLSYGLIGGVTAGDELE
ncbi:biotin-dependent carboxyltransferase family protein [Profundibacterium mesophilum]|uniref:Allophanate hydrolase n=1 Tax=Profundibacterium mesophilum KAUST100406-0324 TaxID=1037889 RepID=A0A921NTP4_9RHOB|nr:biotin-dependent carboxyltransferase family protein [Profundibacterium mesophilum]KAF0674559.1 allophanate hydrolase [Profundibacterium mesophilum KAUST100406-0324]